VFRTQNAYILMFYASRWETRREKVLNRITESTARN